MITAAGMDQNTTPPFGSRVLRGHTILNKIVFLLIALPLLAGYNRALIGGTVINVQAWASVLLLAMLAGRFVLRRQKSVSILFLSALFVIYALIGYMTVGDFTPVIAHAFTFAPFIVAFLLVELRVGHDFSKVMCYLTVCAAVGAIAANVIHVFHPETLGLLLKEDDDLDTVLSVGRVGWAGYVLALPLVAQLGFLDIYSRSQRRLVLLSLPIVIAGALLTFNRTLLIALLAMFIYLLVSFRRQIRFKVIALIAVVFTAGGYFLSWWSETNPILLDLFDYRILGFLTGTSDTSGDIGTRYILYGEYWDRLKHSYFLGQGLGVPVSTFLGPSSWIDISLLSFALPFGILGVLLFSDFIKKIYLRIRTHIENDKVQRLFVVVLFLGLGMSLNDDIWSHKYFSVYFVYMINASSFWSSGRFGLPPV